MTAPFDRIACCIPGCHRGSRKWPSGTLICGHCGRRAPAARKAWRAAQRAAKGEPWDSPLGQASHAAWEAFVAACTEAAAGI